MTEISVVEFELVFYIGCHIVCLEVEKVTRPKHLATAQLFSVFALERNFQISLQITFCTEIGILPVLDSDAKLPSICGGTLSSLEWLLWL